MEKLKKILFLAILLFPFMLILSACDNPPPQKAQKKQNTVTKKIVRQDQNQQVEKAPAMPQASEPKTVESIPEKSSAAEKNKVQPALEPEVKASQPSEEKIVNTSTATAKPMSGPESAAEKTQEANKEIVTISNTDKQDSEKSYEYRPLKESMEKDKKTEPVYVSEGKIDPFLSPIKKINEEEKEKIKNRKHTPLEKLDFSQLKLVAIINMKSKNKSVAMVQESNGKGYMVKVGTYIGTNSGRIIEIKDDEIVIKERIKNFKGVFEDSIKTMKLQKKSDG